MWADGGWRIADSKCSPSAICHLLSAIRGLPSADDGDVVGHPLVVRHTVLAAVAAIAGGRPPPQNLVKAVQAIGLTARVAQQRLALARLQHRRDGLEPG